jgi:integron integrase
MGDALRLLDRVRGAIRARHYSRRTEDAYVVWIRRYIVYHRKVSELGADAIAAFLTWLAVDRKVSASTQNQALSALLFLYREVLRVELGPIEHVPRARTSDHVPVVLSVAEVRAALAHLTGVPWLVVGLLYGAGLRLQECLELRVKDVDFDRGDIVVRRGKGQKDRRTLLPELVRERLRQHLDAVRRQHERDLRSGYGRVVLPAALERKYPNAAADWRWQFVFPAGRLCRDVRWGSPSRVHLHESVISGRWPRPRAGPG